MLNKTSTKFLKALVGRGIFQDVSEAANFILCLAQYPELSNQFLTKILFNRGSKEKLKPSVEEEVVVLPESASFSTYNVGIKEDAKETILNNHNDGLDSILSVDLDTLF